MSLYLHPTYIIDSDHRSVIAKAEEIVAGCMTDSDVEKAQKLFLFARDGVPFSRFVKVGTREDFQASTTLERKKGYCAQKAVVLAALARAAGIPARLGLADIRNHAVAPQMLKLLRTNIFKVHVFVEMLIEGEWRRATPAFDTATCSRVGWPVVRFDGENDGMLSPELAGGERFIEYIKWFGTYPDLPYELLKAELHRFYGDKTMDEWQSHAKKTGSKEAVC